MAAQFLAGFGAMNLLGLKYNGIRLTKSITGPELT